jgi:hypothetical protein
MQEYLSPPKAGKLVGRGPQAIVQWIRKRGLPAIVLPSGQYLIEREKFFAWLDRQGVKL